LAVVALAIGSEFSGHGTQELLEIMYHSYSYIKGESVEIQLSRIMVLCPDHCRIGTTLCKINIVLVMTLQGYLYQSK
jgi:hypothetical protein